MSEAESEHAAPPPASPPPAKPRVTVTEATVLDADAVAAVAKAAADQVRECRVQRPGRRLAGSFSHDSEVGQAAVVARTSLSVASTADLVQAGAPQRKTVACTVEPDERGSCGDGGERVSADRDGESK